MLIPRLQTRRVSRQNGTPSAVAFTRSGATAYDSAGNNYAANVPRFDTGAGVPGTTNLLTPNQSDCESFTAGVEFESGWSRTTPTTIARDTSKSYQGTSSMRCDVAAVNNGLELAHANYVTLAASTTYTGSVYIWAPAGATLQAEFGGGQVAFTGNGDWKRASVTVTTGAGGAANLDVRANAGGTFSFWVDALQVEMGSGATPWARAAAPRTATTARNGLLVEELTANILTANQSSAETDLTGFSTLGSATQTRDTTRFWSGTACVKVITGGAANDGTSVNQASATGGSWTGSFYVQGTGDFYIQMRVTYTDASSDQTTINFTANANTWTRMAATVAANGGKTVQTLSLFCRAQGAAGGTIYLDGWQVENRAYATSWCVGATTRNAETCTLPAANTLNLTQGAVFVRFTITGNNGAYAAAGGNPVVLFDSGVSASTNRFLLYFLSGGGTCRFYTWGSTTANTASASTTAFAPGTYIMAGRWADANSVWRNGAKIASGNITDPPATLPLLVRIGNDVSNGSQPGVAFNEVVVLPVAPSDSEMATLTVNPNAPLPHLPGATLYLPFSRGSLQAYARNQSCRNNLYGTEAS